MKRRKKPQTRRPVHFKKGDLVMAIAGEDAGRGKPGKVLQVLPRERRAIVEGYNYVKKHMRKTQDNPQGGIVEKEAPIHVSNLMKFEGEAAKPAKKKAPAKSEKAS
jgi:large subunit ribosomal protein L24